MKQPRFLDSGFTEGHFKIGVQTGEVPSISRWLWLLAKAAFVVIVAAVRHAAVCRFFGRNRFTARFLITVAA